MKAILIAMVMGAIALPTWANNKKEPQIASNQSSVKDAGLINNIASAAIGMGAKEPLNITETQTGGKRVLVVAGGNGIKCQVPVSAENKMSGISCK